MRPNDLLKVLLRNPFLPLRIVLTDGTTYDVHDPDLVQVERSIILTGSPASRVAKNLWHREVIDGLRHIIRLEPIGPQQPKTQTTAN
jgi:hypothetical protein